MNGLEISKGPSLAGLTSIGLGGSALAVILVCDAQGLESLPEAVRRLGGRPLALGRGSNILARAGELPLTLIRLGAAFNSENPKLLREEAAGTEALFAVQAAAPLQTLVGKISRAGWSGLQGLAGVPGSLGGAVAMNAGSFGMDLRGCLEEVSLFSPRLGLVTRRADQLDLAYRHFSVPELAAAPEADNWFVITGAVLRLRREAGRNPAAELDEFFRRKAASQPLGERSAGCVFKNHPQGPAGLLLEQAGMKGRALGGMAFSDLHANFLVNKGTGQSAEAFELIDSARRAVRQHCGADLELEVRLWE